MKFAWTEKDKERFFKRAERQLKAAGIDFVQVDREQIGVKEWNAEKQTAGAVYVWLTSYPYNHFSTRKRGLLKRLGNWECTDHFKKGGSKPIYMHSRLIYTSYREEKKPRKEKAPTVLEYHRGKAISLNNLSNKSIKGIWRKVKEIAGAEPAFTT